MCRKIWKVALVLSACCLMAERIKSPAEIQAELDRAQKEFNTAKEMFNPWYTGPLITGSADCAPKGHTNIQPYIFVLDDFGSYNDNRKAVNVEDTWVLNPLFIYQYGLGEWCDVTLNPQGFFRWQGDESGAGFGDLNVTFGFQLMRETPRTISVRATIGETFPTGRYKNLGVNKGGIDATGDGIYATVVGLNFSKLLYWFPLHPMRLRLSTTYTFPNTKAHVEGFHAYGGGFGTDGNVRVGQSYAVDFGYEFSITQRWVFALDLAYSASKRNHFTGDEGVNAAGNPVGFSDKASDQLSIAPAIEYNPSPKGGFIGGFWVTLTGKNSSQFAGLVLSYTYLF